MLEKPHSKGNIDLDIIITKNDTNLIGHYNDYIQKPNNFLDFTDYYNKADFTVKLLKDI